MFIHSSSQLFLEHLTSARVGPLGVLHRLNEKSTAPVLLELPFWWLLVGQRDRKRDWVPVHGVWCSELQEMMEEERCGSWTGKVTESRQEGSTTLEAAGTACAKALSRRVSGCLRKGGEVSMPGVNR